MTNLIDKAKECTKINNSNKSLYFTYNKLIDGSILVGVFSKKHRQIFFMQFVQNEKEILVYLLNNSNDEKEEITKSDNCSEIRKKIIELLIQIYPLEKSEMSKKYCYPKD